ncbi:hypothetical protein PLCT1_00499 [Planctomycetaceae bacterium]|nr:hypothetical protein PLCT1_00499 [Planctomycetaceae bacterium]
MDTAKKLLVASVVLLVAAQSAFSWGNATHVYFAKELGTRFGLMNAHEMYGAVLPDAFNFMFDANGQILYDATHHQFLPLYQNAWKPALKSTGFGFVSHNDTWGADYTAHHSAFTSPGEGYAIAKGAVLAPQLIPVLVQILTNAGLPSPDAEYVAGALAPEMGHDLSETAVDLLVRRNLDRAVGMRMMAAAQTRPADVPQLLATTYGPGLAAATGVSEAEARALIIGAENDYRTLITQYGLAFTLAEPKTIAMLAAQTAPVAEMLIEANVGGVDVTVTAEQVAGFIQAAITVVEPDYRRELAATLRFVERSMREHGVRPVFFGFACDENGGEVPSTDAATAPEEFSLGQNYPNPFNPSTTIAYAVPADARVSLRVYNTLGEQVATLVDELLPAGQHQSTWHAAGMPSGLYFYKLESAGVTMTKRMMLVK